MEAQTLDFYLVRNLNGITYSLEFVSLSLTQSSLEDLVQQLTNLSMGKKSRTRCTIEAFLRTIMMQRMVVSVVTYLPLQVSSDAENCSPPSHALVQNARPHKLLTDMLQHPRQFTSAYGAITASGLHSLFLNELTSSNNNNTADQLALHFSYERDSTLQRAWAALGAIMSLTIVIVVGCLRHDAETGLSFGADIMVFILAMRTLMKCLSDS